jgi:flagellar motor switch protein FliG
MERGNLGETIKKLHGLPPESLNRYLAHESPRTAGLVLANLQPAQAAKIMANMTADRQKEVVSAMRGARQAPPAMVAAVLEEVAQKLSAQPDGFRLNPPPEKWSPESTRGQPVNVPLPDNDIRRRQAMQEVLAQAKKKRQQAVGAQPTGEKGRKIDGMALAATILRYASPEVRHNVSDHAPDLYTSLRKRMFVFEDLCNAPDDTLQLVFSAVDTDQAALALRFAPDKLVKRALASISPRRAEDIRRDMKNASGRVRVGDIEETQQRILEVALKLQRAGKALIDAADPDLAG